MLFLELEIFRKTLTRHVLRISVLEMDTTVDAPANITNLNNISVIVIDSALLLELFK